MDFQTRYKKLNEAQKQAVDTIEGPVMVIAGPGTGKTELLSMRAANILQKTDTLPENILCLTFTESGANAMRERLTQIIGPAAYKIAIHTFHSFGTEVINQNGQFFYQGANFRPADELSSYEVIRSIFDELGYDSPLASKMNDEYTYLPDALTVISELKKSGLTSDELLQVLDANDAVLDAIEPQLADIFGGRISKATLAKLPSVLPLVRESSHGTQGSAIPSLSNLIADSLEASLSEADITNSTKPITAWRNKWMKKSESGSFVFKSREYGTKLRAVSYLYFQYLNRMQEAELYDFDDMILRVVHAIEVFPELRFNLQEKYQYIMVDEFQDTNLAQMRILHNLATAPSQGDQPNVMVVGDDDQAIYSFQGADVGNIHAFLAEFPTTELVVLTDNYRSTDVILSHARSIITQGSDRLENKLERLNKTLHPKRTLAETSVNLMELPSIHQERRWLVEAIQKQIEQGTKPSSVAVLARRHHELVALLPYFAKAGIAVNYERRDNVLELETIRLAEHIAQLIIALYERRHDIADTLLPELLAHPAFAITPLSIWKLSLKAQKEHVSWLELMNVTPEFTGFSEWLVTQSQALAYTPLEYMLDEILGNVTPRDSFVSPLMHYFFSPANLEETPDAYLTHLEALRTIRSKLREYQPNETPTLQSFVEFVRLHRQLGSTITSTRHATDGQRQAVTLMTAHRSKGLEYDHVYITGAIDSSWGERVRTRARLIGYPENLPLAPAGDTFDERLRLFFVAATRAKNHLTISYSLSDDNAKPTLPASFLIQNPWQPHEVPASGSLEAQIQSAELAWYQPLVTVIEPSMKEALAPMLEQYKLSATHLGAFLDVSRGGPQAFLLNNLLRFPQAMNPSAAYGSAIHATLQRAHAHLAATGKHRPHEDILHDFENQLASFYLPQKAFNDYLQKGSQVLSAYLEAMQDTFSTSQKTELNFANQSVYLGEAHLTGLLDLVDFDGDKLTITDYKTGRAARNWTGRTEYEKIKLHHYKQQLMFYQLLTANSRDYGRYTVEKSVIQFVEPTPSGEIIALEASFSDDDLVRFASLIQKVWQHIITLSLPDVSGYEPTLKGIEAFENDLLNGSA